MWAKIFFIVFCVICSLCVFTVESKGGNKHFSNGNSVSKRVSSSSFSSKSKPYINLRSNSRKNNRNNYGTNPSAATNSGITYPSKEYPEFQEYLANYSILINDLIADIKRPQYSNTKLRSTGSVPRTRLADAEEANRESKFDKAENLWQLTAISSSDEKSKHVVSLYDNDRGSGNQLNVYIENGECLDLPSFFYQSISSIKTWGNCVLLCSDFKCSGECKEFGGAAGAQFVGNDFNDLAASIALCPLNGSNLSTFNYTKPDAAHSYNETVITAGISGNKVRITLYEHKNLRGKRIQVDIGAEDPCLNFPASFDNQISSLDIRGNCATLCEHQNCIGSCVNYGPNMNPGYWVGRDFNDKFSSMKLCAS